jgi:DnaK suppressor protein
MLSKKNQKYFKSLLNERLDGLLDEATKTVSGMTDHRETFPDPTDRATLESERNFTLRIRDRERRLISKINGALDRLDLGTFGVCEECGEDISDKRLKARPVTTRCINCKKKQENDEKLKGL